MISAVKYGGSYGFIGFYIVKPEFRGQGIGIKIWETGMSYLKGRMIGLDGVPNQVDNYKKSDFVFAHRNITFKGKAKQMDVNLDGVVELLEKDFNLIKNYDKQFVPAERDVFLRCWVSQSGSNVIGFMEDEILKGYGKIRKCREGFKIGPLFANNTKIAESLFVDLQNKIPQGSYFTLDIPEINKEALNIAERFKMEYSFETARMYKSGIPKIDLNKVFGVTTYELG
jgi:transcription termination factor Rho